MKTMAPKAKSAMKNEEIKNGKGHRGNLARLGNRRRPP